MSDYKVMTECTLKTGENHAENVSCLLAFLCFLQMLPAN